MNTFSWQTEGVTARSDAPASSAKDERSNAEKQAVVVDFLRSRVGSAALSARQIAAALSEGGAPPVDLRVETAVDAMVRANARVRVQFDEEMEAHYEYQAKHEDVHDAASLVTFVNNSPNGVVASEVFDCYVGAERDVENRAGKESEIPNFKASYLGRFPLVSADFWTSDHLSERSRSMDAFSGTRARETLELKRR